MTDADKTWGAFAPVMPSFIRLVIGVIVLIVVEAVVLGFPGVGYNISGTSITVANVAVFAIGLIVALVVLKFGTQLAETAGDAYKNYRSWIPLLSYFFQIVAIAILYEVTKDLAASYFASDPWAFPLIFLLIALIPTLKVVTSIIHTLEGTNTTRHSQN